MMRGDLDGAVAPYREAIRLAPDARAWANLGNVYYAQGRLSGSGARLRGSGAPRARLGYDPPQPRRRPRQGRRRGRARARTGRPRSISAGRPWRSNPRDPRQLKNVALCLAKLGERDEALRAAAAALEAGPASADTRYGVAAVHALVGDPGQALVLLEQALDLGASPSLAEQDDEFAAVRALPGFRSVMSKARAARIKEVKRAS